MSWAGRPGRHVAVLVMVSILTSAVGEAEPGAAPRAGSPTGQVTDRATPRPGWRGPDGEPLPFASDREVLSFLRDAEIVAAERIDEGVTEPFRVLLRRDGVEARAIFRHVDELLPESPSRALPYRDRAIHECAAYELARLLGLWQVPPTVPRRHDGRNGSLQLWVENASSHGTRLRQGLPVPGGQRWSRQLNAMNVFDALIGNPDRNQGNMLVDAEGRIWWVDHTRAFRWQMPFEPEFEAIERDLWTRLRELDEDTVRDRLGGFLARFEVASLLRRLEKLVEHFEALIRERGEAAVLY